MKKIISMIFAVSLVLGFTTSANAAKTLKCQTVISAKADEVVMLKDFTDTVTALTGGSLKFEIMPAGTVVGVKETLDAVDKGLIDCGFAWTHYWSGDHPAAMLFGSPVAGGGVGIYEFEPGTDTGKIDPQSTELILNFIEIDTDDSYLDDEEEEVIIEDTSETDIDLDEMDTDDSYLDEEEEIIISPIPTGPDETEEEVLTAMGEYGLYNLNDLSSV